MSRSAVTGRLRVWLFWLVSSLPATLVAFAVSDWLFDSVTITSFGAALASAAVPGLVEIVVAELAIDSGWSWKVVLLGLAGMLAVLPALWLASLLVSGFSIAGFWTYLVVAVLVTAAGFAVDPLVKRLAGWRGIGMHPLSGRPPSAEVAAYPRLVDARGDERALVAIIDDDELPRDIRGLAIFHLQQLNATAAVPRIAAELADRSSELRVAAAFALGALVQPVQADAVAVVLPPLLSALEDDDQRLRLSAASSLGRMRARAAVPQLRSLLQDDDPGCRLEAARALARIGDRGSVELVRKAASSEGRLSSRRRRFRTAIRALDS